MSKRIAASNLDRDNWEEDDPREELGVFQKASPDEMKTRLIHKAKRRVVRDGPAVPVFQNFAGFGVKNSNASPAFSFLAQSKDVVASDAPMFGTNKCETDGVSTTVFSFGGKSADLSKVPTFSFTSSTEKSDANSRETKLESSPNTKKFEFSPKPILDQGKNDDKFSSFDSQNKSKGKENLSSIAFCSKPSCDDKTTTLLDKFTSSPPKVNGNRSKSPQKIDNSNQNKVYLSHLKSLNIGLINWVKKHVDKNPYVDLSPVFDDYKSYFSDLKKKYKCSGNSGQSGVLESQPKVLFGSASDGKSGKQPPSSLNSKNEATSEKKPSPSSPLVSCNLKQTSSISEPHDSKTISSTTTKSSMASSFGFGDKSSSSPSNASSVVDFFKASDPTSKPFTFSTDSSNARIFGGNNKPAMFNFGNDENKSSTSPAFAFGSTTVTTTTPSEEAKQTEAESDEPPKQEIKEVKEDDALYEKKVKLFYKKEGAWVDKGVGTLFLKKVDDKAQLIVRAFTNLGNILLNIVLNDTIPTQRQGKNNVLIVCVPNPPVDPKSEDKSPVSMLIRVKTAEDADELLNQIDMHKK